MTLVASLGMYDHPGQQAANDRLWTEIARLLRARGVRQIPDALDRTRSVQELWHDPQLLFAQICGYPLARDFHGSLRVLALPRYDAPGCEGDTHRSFIVVRTDDAAATLADFRGRRAAINDIDSNSGMNLFRAAVGQVAGGVPFFASVCATGSHRASIHEIVAGNADIAAIDAVTYAALARFEPALASGVRILASTPVSPTLPFVTSHTTPVDTVAALRTSLAQVLAAPDFADARAALFLVGMTGASIERFDPLLQLERDAALASYPDLR